MERFGVCILGMGDCTPKITRLSEQFLTNVSRNIKEKMINIQRSNNFMTSTKQVVRIKNLRCGGDLQIKGVQQKAISKINYSAMTDSIDENTLKEIQENSIKEVIDTNDEIKTEFMSGGGADINETNRITATNIREVRDSYNYNDFKSITQKLSSSQEIDLGNYDVGKDCRIEDISQDIQLDMVVSDISKRMTKSFEELMSKNESDVDRKSKTKIESTGFFGDLGRAFTGIFKAFGIGLALPILLPILGMVFLAVIGFVVFMLIGKKRKAAMEAETAPGAEGLEGASDFAPTAPALEGTEGTEGLEDLATGGRGYGIINSLGNIIDAASGRSNMYGGWA